ncbi:MAG: RNA polymerase sigma factor [Roseburia sp.]|nr:RNA polymerase sigma factor [Roseburia sp.]MCM1096592.1 RNA polymerase sigma factor [Ruminococcus flavefaciens]
MEDNQIIDLYWARSETAISETVDKYGRYCHSIAFHILHSHEDSEECVNDTMFNAWKAMPPQRPNKLSVFLGTITRNLSLKKWEQYSAEKRGSGQVPLALEELRDCIPASENVGQAADDLTLAEILNRFLSTLPKDRRKIFMRRYWYMCSIKEIAEDFSIGESRVKMALLRSRNDLKQLLEKEGYDL